MASLATDDSPASRPPPSGWRLLKTALASRRAAVMLAFGFGSGLPYTLLIGTMSAWLSEAQVGLAVIGILSWIGLLWSFKFLWSPAIDQLVPPLLARLGRRRSWLILCQLMLVACLLALANTDPVAQMGRFGLLAMLAAFFAATQDVVIDAWRIDVADERVPLEILSTLYQFGYRISALFGGALALVLAARIGWPLVYGGMGLMMIVALLATMAAPDTARPAAGEGEAPQKVRSLHRTAALLVVGGSWAWAILIIGRYMVQALTARAGEEVPKASEFTLTLGPWIIVATVVVPILVAAMLRGAASARGGKDGRTLPGLASRAASHAYAALLSPLIELLGRLGWGIVVVIGLILSYRLTDAMWGPFAFPFYLDELGYTNDEVAFASKIFGVGMTMAGIALGGVMFAFAGRMPTLLLGAVTAAATNLLYADLAVGAPAIDALCRAVGFDQLEPGLRMTRLMVAISAENIAGGLAGAAFVAYLSSIVSKSHSAVQFALMSSLTFLVGTLGRGAVGEYIERVGYAPVFRFSAAVGLIAVLFCLLEWKRSRQGAARV